MLSDSGNQASTKNKFNAQVQVANILICEDDDLYRQIAEAAFAGSGHELRFAVDGDAALTRLKKEPFDLVVTDLVMPGRDGLEIIRAVRGSDKAIPILAMTAGLTTLKGPLIDAAKALGADDVIEKPFRPIALRQRADELLLRAAEKRGETAA